MKIFRVFVDDDCIVQVVCSDDAVIKQYNQHFVSRIVFENRCLGVMFIFSAKCFNLPGKPVEKFIKFFDLNLV